MKNIIKNLFAAFFIAAFAASIFAAAPFAKNNAVRAVYKFNQVPPSIFDPNFNEWQPDRPVPLVPAQINDIMMTDGRQIYYNPMVVRQVPPKVAAFFLAHEYGHLYTNMGNEFQADQFAARVYAQTDIEVVKAAIWHFYNIQGGMCDQMHGCGWQRALNIGETAGFAPEQIRAIVNGDF